MKLPFHFKEKANTNRINTIKRRLGILLIVLSMPLVMLASHFRYGSISWTNNTGNTVVYKVSQAWRMSAFPGSGTIGASINTLETFDFGDFASANIILTVTSVNPGEDWFYGEAILTHTYATPGNYIAMTTSCCRIFGLQNNSSGNYTNMSTVNVGSGNSSPASSIVPIVDVPENNPAYNFNIPAADPNGSTLSFRFSTSSEAGPGFVQPTGLSLNSATGQMTFNTVGAAIGNLYTTQVMISDGTVEVPLDFIIRISSVVGTPPYFNYPPTPANASVLTFNAGATSGFTIQATDDDAGNTVTLSVAGAPLGSSLTPALRTSGNPVSSAFSWTPTAADIGTYVLNFNAQDNTLQSASSSVTINVIQACNLVFTGFYQNVCIPGGNTGAIDVTLTGSSGSVTYDWSDLPGTNNGEDRTGLTAGTYTVTATDGSGCTATQTFTISEPATALSCTISVNPSVTVAGHAANTIYRGYGPQSVLLTASGAGGTAGYTYAWSPSGTGPTKTVSPIITTVYNVTVTDANGCISTCSVTINVVDVRCGKNLDKVMVCHKDPKNGKQPLCIGTDGVADHLAHGDKLGDCTTSFVGGRMEATSIAVADGPEVIISPNPSTTSFNLQLKSDVSERITIKVMDIYGKPVEVKTQWADDLNFRLGYNYKPGVYFIDIRKGDSIKTMKWLKKE